MTEGQPEIPPTAEELVDELLVGLARHVSSDLDRAGAVCTNWILVAEWSTTDGDQWVSRWADSNRPYWQHQGLLHHALHGPGGWDRRDG